MVGPKLNLSVVQWNSRGLTRAKLIEFKNCLRTLNPDVVLLSETHWSDNFKVTLQTYNITLKNRLDGYGGVAILTKKKNISFAPLTI